jgi:hypothetical protein
MKIIKKNSWVKFCACNHLLNFTMLALVTLLPFTSQGGGVVSVPNEAALNAALAGGGTITFACEGTILMTNVENITTNTVLDAAGYTITLSGGNSSQIFIVSNGASLTLNNLTIANGFTTTNAGAIYNGGILMASNCVFNANNATGTNGLSPTNCVH